MSEPLSEVWGESNGGRYWTRTSDPRRVKAMLYQLSQAPDRQSFYPINSASSSSLAARRSLTARKTSSAARKPAMTAAP